MRRPPSPALLPSYPVAGGVGLMAIAVTVMTSTGRWPLERFVIGPTAFRGEPWRLLTSALAHGSARPRIFNVYWLWVFGTLLEEVLGHARLLALVALFAAGSAAAEYALFRGGIGLSGVGYGLFAMLWVLSSRDPRFAGAVDARTAQAFAAWFVFCIVATQLEIMPVANVAHAVGALLGALVGASMHRGKSPSEPSAPRVLAALGIPAVLAVSFAGATTFRPRINLRHDGHQSFQLGYDAIQAGRFEDAIRRYRETVQIQPDNAKAWHNLGIGYAGAGQGRAALAAFRRAYELDGSHDRRSAYLNTARRVADEAERNGDYTSAASALREMVLAEPDDLVAWRGLARSYHAQGREDDEKHALAELDRLVRDGGVR